MCGMFVSHECPKNEHLDMETDPSIVDKTTSLDFLFFHGISVPLQIPIYPIIDVIVVDDTKVAQSIIGEIEDLEFPILCPHEVVCHDVDETLRIIMHAIQVVILHHLIELTSLIHHQVQWFHFLFVLSIWKIYPYSIVVLVGVEALLGSFLIHPFLVHAPIHGVIISEKISK